jgi:F0F1-type ATP synthase assembly protein I
MGRERKLLENAKTCKSNLNHNKRAKANNHTRLCCVEQIYTVFVGTLFGSLFDSKDSLKKKNSKPWIFMWAA